MSIKIKFENSGKGVVYTCSGIVTGNELIDANNTIISNPNIIYQICDVSKAKDIRIDVEQMHAIAIQDNSYPPDSKLSCVVFIGDLSKWKTLYDSYEQMSKEWVGRRTNFTTTVFDNIKDARAWLSQNKIF